MLSFLVMLSCLAAAGCSGASSQPPDRRLLLETQLARLPASADPRTTLQRSQLLRALGLQDQAHQELAAAIDQAREQLSWATLGLLWREQGAVFIEQGRPEQALEVFGKRLKSLAALDEAQKRAEALVDSAYAFALLGHVGQADEAVTEARVLGGEALLGDPLTVERLGLIAELLHNTEQAKQHFAQAAQRYRQAGRDEVSAARAEVYHAKLLAAEGDSDPLFRLNATVEGLVDPEPELLAKRFQAELDLVAHTYDRCLRGAERAVTLADERGHITVAKLARVIAARCAELVGQRELAIRRAGEAGAIVERQLRYVSGDLPRQELGFEAFQIYRVLFGLQALEQGPGAVAAAFETSERARGRTHLDAVVRRQVSLMSATLPLSPALSADKEEAQERVRRLTQALLDSRSRVVAERHRNALWALEDIKEAMRRDNPLLARVQPPEPAELARVQAELLDDESVLLSYFMTSQRLFVMAVDKQSATLARLDTSAADIDAAVRDYRGRHLLVQDGDLGALKQAGHKLYQQLLGPVGQRIAGKRRLIIIPHGALSALPFESLVDPDGKFLIQQHEVSYSLSATLALALRDSLRKQPAGRAKRRAFVGMGDPVYDWPAFAAKSPEGRSPAASRGLALWADAAGEPEQKAAGLPRLPGTAKELQAIAKLFGSDQQLYLRAQADEQLVKEGALSGYRIVHIASHGLMAAHYQALALSLNPNAEEDGFLMNSEIAELSLDADLVVLSACRTGNTRRRSAEPVAGLALSLRSAGASRVVLSLWSVDDAATAELMMSFYRPLVKEGADYSSSLAEAKRIMIEKGPSHPFYWAPFILLGS